MAQRATLVELRARASEAIERREQFIYDAADEHFQMVENVAHTTWFLGVVAQHLIDNVKKYSHLSLTRYRDIASRGAP